MTTIMNCDRCNYLETLLKNREDDCYKLNQDLYEFSCQSVFRGVRINELEKQNEILRDTTAILIEDMHSLYQKIKELEKEIKIIRNDNGSI